jgi:hypothetical protein
MIDERSTLPVTADAPRRVSTVAELPQIPAEEIWLQKHKERAPAAPTGSTHSTS